MATVQNKISGDIQQIDVTPITTINPTKIKELEQEYTKDHVIPFHEWIKHNANCTLYLTHMKAPQCGFLQCEEGNWFFLPGCSSNTMTNRNAPITLRNFPQEGSTLLQSAQLLPGWVTRAQASEKQNVFTAQTQAVCRIIFAQSPHIEHTNDIMIQHLLHQEDETFLCKVSATELSSLETPKSIQSHQQMTSTDKDIWDKAYAEEYFGLHNNTHTWQYITEEEYQLLKPNLGHALPMIALETIKHDEYGHPQRAKYRICVLENMDPNPW
eukprot:11807574-Ditylum_brightwellii.AAC.1